MAICYVLFVTAEPIQFYSSFGTVFQMVGDVLPYRHLRVMEKQTTVVKIAEKIDLLKFGGPGY